MQSKRTHSFCLQKATKLHTHTHTLISQRGSNKLKSSIYAACDFYARLKTRAISSHSIISFCAVKMFRILPNNFTNLWKKIVLKCAQQGNKMLLLSLLLLCFSIFLQSTIYCCAFIVFIAVRCSCCCCSVVSSRINCCLIEFA